MNFYEDAANIFSMSPFSGVGPHTVAQFDPCQLGACIGRFDATICAFDDSGAEIVDAFAGTFRRGASSLDIEFDRIASPNLDSLLAGVSATLDVSGTNIRARVTSLLGLSLSTMVRFEAKGAQP